jgi:peroxiredoxin
MDDQHRWQQPSSAGDPRIFTDMDTIINTGEKAPGFQLPDLKGNLYSLGGYPGWIRVVNFWSAECEWCERVDREWMAFHEASKAEVKAFWIASNASESPDLIERVAAERNLPIVLMDRDQQVANQYGAQVTPHFFVVDGDGILCYQGAWDDITFRQRVAMQVYVPQVIEALIDHRTPAIKQTQPYGCMLVRYTE